MGFLKVKGVIPDKGDREVEFSVNSNLIKAIKNEVCYFKADGIVLKSRLKLGDDIIENIRIVIEYSGVSV